MRRLSIITLAIVIALGSMSVGYAHFSKTFSFGRNYVYTPTCSDPFTWAVSNDDGQISTISPYGIIDPGDDGGGTNYDRWGATSSDDPSGGPPPGPPAIMGQPFPRYDKDAARTTARVEADPNYLTVVIDNAYPYYNPTVFFAFACPGSTQGTIENIILEPVTPTADITVTYDGIQIGQVIEPGQEAVGALHILVEQSAAQNATYAFRLSIQTSCATRTCGTAYAYGNGYAKCFLNYGFSNWGWTNGLLPRGTYTFPLYAGAAHCDITTGRLAGTVNITYSNCTVTVTFNLNPGYTMNSTALYIGTGMFPIKNGSPTVSPGQYPYKHTLSNATTDSYTISLNNGLCGSPLYIIAHADACWFP